MGILNIFKNNNILIIAILVISVLIGLLSYYAIKDNKSSFNEDLQVPLEQLSEEQPKKFPVLETPIETPKVKVTENDYQNYDFKQLVKPDVPEEIGLSMVYPQGQGVGMNKSDSNSFTTSKPGPLLSDHITPESYGASSLSDPYGNNGSSEGARIIQLNNAGNQLNYKPVDETENDKFAVAYNTGEITSGPVFVSGSEMNYNDQFIPEQQLKLKVAPGQQGTANCEETYPNVVKYNGSCITKGDIPYGKVVNGEVNPRLVSRWESYTGNYSRENALSPIDGTMYPTLNVTTVA